MPLPPAIERSVEQRRRARIVPVLRVSDYGTGHAVALRLVAAIPGRHDLLAAVKTEAPNALVDLGTGRTKADVERALTRGADSEGSGAGELVGPGRS